MQNDPVACEFRDCLKDFCDACRDCTWKADVSFFERPSLGAGNAVGALQPGRRR